MLTVFYTESEPVHGRKERHAEIKVKVRSHARLSPLFLDKYDVGNKYFYRVLHRAAQYSYHVLHSTALENWQVEEMKVSDTESRTWLVLTDGETDVATEERVVWLGDIWSPGRWKRKTTVLYELNG